MGCDGTEVFSAHGCAGAVVWRATEVNVTVGGFGWTFQTPCCQTCVPMSLVYLPLVLIYGPSCSLFIISSSSSSPLLSLVQVPAKLAINLSIHTQHTYDNGVDRTGRQGIKKNTAFTWERGGIFFFNPQTMLHLEYSLRTETKKTPQHKSTYTINTWLATGETYPALASSRPVQCHLLRRRSQTCSP